MIFKSDGYRSVCFPGELIFDFESNITSLESNLTARCTLSNTPGWDRIGIFKSTEAEDMGVIAEIDRLSDNTTKNETASGVEILPSSRFNYDEVFLEIQITNVTCDNDGGYYCGARKGNTSEITEYNSLTEDSFIIVTCKGFFYYYFVTHPVEQRVDFSRPMQNFTLSISNVSFSVCFRQDET